MPDIFLDRSFRQTFMIMTNLATDSGASLASLINIQLLKVAAASQVIWVPCEDSKDIAPLITFKEAPGPATKHDFSR